MKNLEKQEVLHKERSIFNSPLQRRSFLQFAGAGVAGMALVAAGCRKDKGFTSEDGVNLGSGDIGILNYAYALEQLEAAFYTQAFATPYYGQTNDDYDLWQDVRDQEIAHREFFKKVLGTDAIPNISTDFSMVTFADRGSVVSYAVILEDMVISAMNGVVRLFQNTEYIKTVNKMVSVEARHSSYFRNILSYNSFASATAVEGNGLDLSASPATILAQAQGYIHTRFDASKLPN